VLRDKRWVVLFDGTEVVQYDSGLWSGRFLHPELGRLLVELASAPMPGLVLLTSRFSLPDLERRPHARLLLLAALDVATSCQLLRALGARGSDSELEAAARWAGLHAKAVELLGTFLAEYRAGVASEFRGLPEPGRLEGTSDEEHHVIRVVSAFQAVLPRETQDVLALATAFREPPPEAQLVQYLVSDPVRVLLNERWRREYRAFSERGSAWVRRQIELLVRLRLLGRVTRQGAAAEAPRAEPVIDAHPLVRRSFEHVLGAPERRQS